MVLNKRVTADLILSERPQIVITATGSASIVPQIPGFKEAEFEGRAFKTNDFLMQAREIGQSVIIAGGGFIGCEIGVYLAGMGKKVTIIEMTKALASGMPVSNRLMLLKMLSDHRVNSVLNAQVVEITPQGALVNVKGKQRKIKANNIVFALGMTPRSQLGDELEGNVPHLSMIGDCAQPGNVLNAVWGGFHAARII